jgi:hypothetical protein
MFRNSLVHLQTDSFMVCFTCIGVREHTLLSSGLNINLENFAFLWFVLYNHTTMHGAKNHKQGMREATQTINLKTFCLSKCKLKSAKKHNVLLSARNIHHVLERTHSLFS